MSIVLQRSPLVAALAALSAVAKRDISTNLSIVHMICDDEILNATAGDGSLFLTCTLDAPQCDPFELALDLNFLNSIISELECGEINLVVEGALVKLIAPGSKYVVPSYAASDYAVVPDVAGEVATVNLHAGALRKALDLCAVNVASDKSTDMKAKSLMMACSGQNMRYVAVGRGISCTEVIQQASGSEFSLFLPGASVNHLRRTLKECEESEIVMLRANDRLCEFIFGDFRLLCGRLALEMPDTTKFFALTDHKPLTFRRETLLKAVKRISVQTRGGSTPDANMVLQTRCEFVDGNMTMRAINPGGFEALEIVPFIGKPELDEPRIALNDFYLEQALSALSGEAVCMWWAGEKRILILTDSEDQSCKMCMMPLSWGLA